MNEKELKQERSRPQSVTNILDVDFDFKWDGIDYCIKKWETQDHPLYLAENCAKHMARKYCNENGIDYVSKAGEIVDKIMGKEFIEYNKLTKSQAVELAEERGISITDKKWKDKTKSVLIEELKDSH